MDSKPPSRGTVGALPQRPETVVYIATSLDRFIARPDGALDWLGGGPEGEDFGWAEFLASVDHIVMGRITFEQVVSFGQWPYEGTPLTVLSTTLETVPEHLAGKAEILSGEPGAVLDHLARRGRWRVYVDGGATVQRFLRADLVDELVLSTIPVLIGDGIPLFGSLDSDLRWQHRSTVTYDQGLVQSTYRRDCST